MFLVMKSYSYNNYVKIMTLLCDCDGWIQTCEVWHIMIKTTNLKWLLFMLDQFLWEITVYTPCLIVLTKRKGRNYCQCLFFQSIFDFAHILISSNLFFSSAHGPTWECPGGGCQLHHSPFHMERPESTVHQWHQPGIQGEHPSTAL